MYSIDKEKEYRDEKNYIIKYSSIIRIWLLQRIQLYSSMKWEEDNSLRQIHDIINNNNRNISNDNFDHNHDIITLRESPDF